MEPLAERMRPRSVDDLVGQEHLVGKEGVLRRMVETDHVPSFILWGPPGVGKTSIANILSEQLDRPYFALSAINSGVKDVRETIATAQKQRFFDSKTPILFIDEIHRFSKSQQDSLLLAVEKGIIILIGATTENPSFEVISALLSRCQVYVLKNLEEKDMIQLLDKALEKDFILSKRKIEIKEYEMLLKFSNGDGRKLHNCLEIVCNQFLEVDPLVIDNSLVEKTIHQNLQIYDKGGEQHYDTVSAFIKSIRGSDPNAAVYYLARMVEGGEDPKFICRRMLIAASEDIGLANPNALLLANACFEAVSKIGYPESRIIMSETAIYLAASPKSNSAYMAINMAQQEVRESGNLSIPLSLRNAQTKLMKKMDYGKDYKYAHDYDNNFAKTEFLPKDLKKPSFYISGSNASENKMKSHLQNLWGDKYKF